MAEMEEHTDADHTYTRKLRSRRSALGDISNKIAEKITDVANKAVGNKRRKLSAGSEGEPSSSTIVRTETVNLAANPIAAQSDSSSASAETSAPVSLLEVEFSNKICRTLPLRLKAHDPAQCYDQLDAMYELYYEQEAIFSAKPYMHNQADLNNKMRSILVDWLVEVHHKMKLQTATLWLTVNLIDRFLTTVNIKRAKLQLVGIAAFFIACKFEEVYAPEAKDFIHITDNAYTREELLKMETDILTALNFEVLVPTGYHFLSRYLNAISASENTRLLASYYAERNLQEPHMLEVRPRVFAGAAVYCALQQQNQRYPGNLGGAETWNRVLREESNLTTADIMGCAENLIKNVREEPITTSKRKLIAAKKKYLLDKNKKVAELELPFI